MTTNKIKVCFIGLGAMGMPMAAHLFKAGYKLTVANRTHKKIDLFKKANSNYTGKSDLSFTDATEDADILITCVGGDSDLRSVAGLTENDDCISPKGVLSVLKSGAIWIDHSTVSDHVTTQLYQIADKKGIQLLDAPISGGEIGAQTGKLSIMVGGDEKTFTTVFKLLKTYGKDVVYIGPSGSGQRAKMVNQICVASVVAGLAEGLAFANKAGIDTKKMLSAISKGAAQSWQMDNRAETMLRGEYDFGFAVDWMVKDLQIVCKTGAAIKADTTISTSILKKYQTLQKKGDGRLDSSALMKLATAGNEND